MTARRKVVERLVPLNLAELACLERMVDHHLTELGRANMRHVCGPLLERLAQKLRRAQESRPRRKRT